MKIEFIVTSYNVEHNGVLTLRNNWLDRGVSGDTIEDLLPLLNKKLQTFNIQIPDYDTLHVNKISPILESEIQVPKNLGGNQVVYHVRFILLK